MKRTIILLLLTTLLTYSNAQNTHSATPAGKTKIINPEGKTPWPYSHSVNSGLQDKAGNIWFGTTEGVYRYDGKSFTNYKLMGGVSVLFLENMVEDKTGNIWFGAKGGAGLYDASASLRTGTQTFTSVEMPASDATGYFDAQKSRNAKDYYRDETPYVTAFTDKSGNVWFGSDLDLLRYDEKSQSAVQTGIGYYLKSEVMPYDSIRRDAAIRSMYQDREGNIWFTITGCSTPLRECYRLDGSRINNPCVLNKCKHDLHNPQDMAAHNKEIAASLTRITKKDGNSIDYISILEDRHGNMWFGTYDRGVYRYDAAASPGAGAASLIHFSDENGLNASAVGVIYEDKAGAIWFGTGDKNQNEGNGAFRYDGKSLTNFTTKDGLCNTGNFRNNVISSIKEDNTGKLWFGGNGGVSSYDPSASHKTGVKAFTSYTKKDGFNEQPVNFVLKDKAGDIWFGTWELGLYRYDGKSFTNFTDDRLKG